MSPTVDIGTLIVRPPEIRDGRPRIAGTGVMVRRVVAWYKLCLTLEENPARLGHPMLAQVNGALVYYHLNRDEIEADIASDDAGAPL